MKHEDFVEYVEELRNKKFKTNRPASLIINNFYSLITIIIISLAIIVYSNYVAPYVGN
jgi:hypothetical protein